MGGGGFTMEPGNDLLDRYVLSLASSPDPRICFLPTASGDPLDHIARFRAAFVDLPCEPSSLSLFRLGTHAVTVADHLLSQDIIYVGGGSMANMLAIWRVHGLDRILREAWERGIVLCGLSAGAMCWFEAGITTSGGRPAPCAGLGLLRGSLSVHDDGEPERHPAFIEAIRSGTIPGGYAADDGVGLLFEDGRLSTAVSSRRDAAYTRVAVEAGAIVKTPCQPTYLGAAGAESPPPPADIDEYRRLRQSVRGRALGGHR